MQPHLQLDFRPGRPTSDVCPGELEANKLVLFKVITFVVNIFIHSLIPLFIQQILLSSYFESSTFTDAGDILRMKQIKNNLYGAFGWLSH